MKEIFLRELLDNLKSARFIMMLVLSMTLFSLNSMIFIHRFEALKEQHERLSAKFGALGNTVWTSAFKPPSSFMFLAEGGEKYLPDAFSIGAGGRIEPKKDFSAVFNPKMPDAPEIDWAFIIKVVFSLYILLMGYSAISGERTEGTLRLVLSNPVNRSILLVAKYLAVMTTVLVPLLAGMALGLIIKETLLPGTEILDMVSRTAFTCIAAALFLSLLTILTLLISSTVSNASTGLLLLLSMWIILYTFPDISSVAVRGSTGAASEYQVASRIKYDYGNGEGAERSFKQFKQRIERGEFRTKEELQSAGVKFVSDIEGNLERVMHGYQDKMRRQSQLTDYLAKLSPFRVFQSVCESAAGTGDIEQARFLEQVRKYSAVYDDYVRAKTGKVVGESEFPFGWYFQYKGEYVEVRTPSPVMNTGEMSDFPKFVPAKPSLARILHDSLPDFSMLLLWNLVLAMGAFLAFNRADVR